MRNSLKKKNLNERPAARAIVALSLTATLAAFGCTTNRTPGNGDPVHSGPGLGPNASPTAGVPGTSSGGAVPNPPMMSSSTYVESLPSANRAKRLPLTPDEAAAVMADHAVLSRTAKVLGPVNPGLTNHQYVSEGVVTGAFRDPALVAANTINPAADAAGVVMGATGGAAGTIVNGVNGTINGTVSGTDLNTGSNTGLAGTTAAATVPGTNGTVATPANVALPFSAGAFAAGPNATTVTPAITGASTTNRTTLTPTATSGAAPTPTATSGAVINPGTAPTMSRTTTARTSTAATRTTTAAAPATGSASANVTSPARTVISNTNGKVTASTGKSQ